MTHKWNFFRKKNAIDVSHVASAEEKEHMLKDAGIILQENVPFGAEGIAVETTPGRTMQESWLPASGYLTVRKRTWHADPLGDEIAPITGERGYYGPWITYSKNKKNQLQDGGRDYLINTDYINADNLGGTHNPANWVGLSQDNSGLPATSATSLTGEITAADLARVQFTTRTHTNGTGNNAWSLVQTFTAANVYTTNGGVQKAGLFNVTGPPVAGTMVHVNIFTAVPLQINDQLQLTWSGTLA